MNGDSDIYTDIKKMNHETPLKKENALCNFIYKLLFNTHNIAIVNFKLCPIKMNFLYRKTLILINYFE